MRLRGIDFGCVLGASGAQGFFGEGYPYHKLLKPFGLNFDGMTFVAKTTTLNPRQGNMPLKEDGITPKGFKPECIVVKIKKGIALNAVGLSGPGAKALLEDGRWQSRKEPFFLSFMSVSTTREERLQELSDFVELLLRYLHNFQAKVGLQINFSCPNVGLNPDELLDEVAEALDIACILDIPLMPKFNATLPVTLAAKVSQHVQCDALCISNTIPWGSYCIDWRRLFGTEVSPLEKFGGGGLSGKPLLPIVEQWLHAAPFAGIRKPINAGGGILCAKDALRLINAGAQSVFIGSMAMLRPWRIQKTIRAVKKLYKQQGE